MVKVHVVVPDTVRGTAPPFTARVPFSSLYPVSGVTVSVTVFPAKAAAGFAVTVPPLMAGMCIAKAASNSALTVTSAAGMVKVRLLPLPPRLTPPPALMLSRRQPAAGTAVSVTGVPGKAALKVDVTLPLLVLGVLISK
jgi:hypothetical protein